MDEDNEVLSPMEVPWYRVTGFYLAELLISVVLYLLLHHYYGQYMLTTLRELWGHGFDVEGLKHVWLIFVWALATTVYAVFVVRPATYLSRPIHVIKGLWLSVNAGFFEEIIYRGLLFLSEMVALVFANWITKWIAQHLLQWANWHWLAVIATDGLFKWGHLHVMLPLADWATLHKLHAQLIDQRSWAFGAAIIVVNGIFRDEHKYLGFVGWVNSWFIGMLMFWLVFNYGMLTAIVAHAMYDAIIFTIIALVAKRHYWYPAYMPRGW